MKPTTWSNENGTVDVAASAALLHVLEDARTRGFHLGTTVASHRTVQGALDANDPVIASRVVTAFVRTVAGHLHAPFAPRAAMGPDLLCFALGTGLSVDNVTLRGEQIVGWGRMDSMRPDEAFLEARRLVERGCGLVELIPDEHGRLGLHAAVPRKSLQKLVSPSSAPPHLDVSSVFAWTIAWTAVPKVWARLVGETVSAGTLMLHALDPHLAVVRLIAERDSRTLDDRAVDAMKQRILGVDSDIPDDIIAALELRTEVSRA